MKIMCKSPRTFDTYQVACGYCIECLLARSQQWAFRVETESRTAKSGYFITLTYAPEHLPIAHTRKVKSPETETGFYNVDNEKPDVTLDQRHFTLWMKRLRKLNDKYKPSDWPNIKYYACGEYGEKSMRPHYHAILFNLSDKAVKEIDKTWPYGFIKVGTVTQQSIHYVVDYVQKKYNPFPKGSVKPFTRISKGMGIDYVKNNYDNHQYHESWELKEGKKQGRPMYPYYFNKVWPRDHPLHVDIKERKNEHALETYEEIYRKHAEKQPLDPLGSIRDEKDHKEYIRNKRKRKRVL